MKNQIQTANENTRAAITTRFAGPTNTRGARIIVKSQRSRKSYSYPYELSGDACHKWAVSQYLADISAEDMKKYGSPLGWGTLADYACGALPDGGFVFVSIK